MGYARLPGWEGKASPGPASSLFGRWRRGGQNLLPTSPPPHLKLPPCPPPSTGHPMASGPSAAIFGGPTARLDREGGNRRGGGPPSRPWGFLAGAGKAPPRGSRGSTYGGIGLSTPLRMTGWGVWGPPTTILRFQSSILCVSIFLNPSHTPPGPSWRRTPPPPPGRSLRKAPHARLPTALALCCAVWFAANSAAAVTSKLLFTDTDNRMQGCGLLCLLSDFPDTSTCHPPPQPANWQSYRLGESAVDQKKCGKTDKKSAKIFPHFQENDLIFTLPKFVPPNSGC